MIPGALAVAALVSSASSVDDVVDAVAVGLDAALDLIGEGARPFPLEIGEELLELDRRRATGCGQKLQACRAAIAVGHEIFIAGRKYQWRLEDLALGDKILGEIAHVRLLRRE